MSAEGRAARPLWLGLLAMIGAAAVLGVLALVSITLWSLAGREAREPARVVARDQREAFIVGEVGPLPGTRFVRMSVSASEAEGGGYSSYRPADQRNIVLLDPVTGESRRLLPDNHRRIDSHAFHPARPGRQTPDLGSDGETVRTDEPLAFYHLMLGREEGPFDLVVGRLSDLAARTVLRDVDGVEMVWTQDPTHLGVISREDRRLAFRVIDTRTLAASPPRPIAID